MKTNPAFSLVIVHRIGLERIYRGINCQPQFPMANLLARNSVRYNDRNRTRHIPTDWLEPLDKGCLIVRPSCTMQLQLNSGYADIGIT